MQQGVEAQALHSGDSAGAAAIRLRGIEKRFGSAKTQDKAAALRGIDLDIHDKELLVLLGPSGCGKTTTLNILAGLEEPSGGEIFFEDQLMNDVPAEERDISMVFQSIALYPHLNVEENITFALRLRKVPKEEIQRRMDETVPMLGMEPYLKRKLHQLSGGERQRVAIAKALVKRPRLFLLDEPFSSLDADMRRQLRAELVRIHHALETTMVFVTHDQEEAMSVADRIVVMRRGEIVQLGSPLDIYYRPLNLWTSRFIGTHPINIFEIALDPSQPQARLQGRTDIVMPMDTALHARLQRAGSNGSVVVGVRPEFVGLTPLNGAAAGGWRGEVFTRQVLGTSILYDVRSGNDHVTSVTGSQELLPLGGGVNVDIEWPRAFFFDKQSEQRIEV
jgi:multiple sugar transport system ATP-binding protein